MRIPFRWWFELGVGIEVELVLRGVGVELAVEVVMELVLIWSWC